MAVNEIRYKGVSYATDDDIKVPSGILYEVKALRVAPRMGRVD